MPTRRRNGTLLQPKCASNGATVHNIKPFIGRLGLWEKLWLYGCPY